MIKSVLGMLAVASLVMGAGPLARAQDYPKGPINLVIPLAPGDAVDIASRAMSEELSRQLKVPVLVVNRPGAGAALATDSVVKARKDGYTILLTINGALTFRRVLDPKTASYDPAKDLTGLGLAMRTPSIIAVRSDAPFKNFREMVEYSKQNPGKVRVGTPGVGSAGDFNVAIINSLTGAGITAVPFTGASPGIAALRGGHVEGIALALGVVSPHLKSGAMRGIVLSSKFPEFPDIPTMADLGQRQNLLGVSVGFFAPAGVPDEVTNVLRPVVERVVKDPAIAAKLFPLGIIQEYLPPEAFLAEMREEHRTVEAIAKKLGLVK
jgi:tripartite-type tricarboxylate transporter receptor subunit TctC